MTVRMVRKIPPRTPVSDELLESVFRRLKKKGPTPQMMDVRKSGRPAELIFLTSEGEVPCRVMEDDLFVIFEMPSGQEDLGAPKQDFLDELSSV